MDNSTQDDQTNHDYLAQLEFFRTMIFDTIREPLAVLDHDLIILSANEAFYKHFLVSPVETRSKLIYEIGNRQWNIPSLRSLLEKILPLKKTIENFEVTHVFPQIGKRTFLLNARQIHGPIFGDVKLILLVFDDITESKNSTEAIFKLNSELQASNDVLENFGHIMSHDLRAPIRAISGFCRILIEDFSAQTTGEIRAYLERILSNASTLDEMVSGLLALSQLAKQPMRQVQINLSEMARDIASRLEQEEPDRSIEFHIEDDFSDNVAPSIIRIALNNLLRNAWKFTRGKTPAVIEFGAKLEEGKRVYYVKDNGVGFNMRYASSLFRMFGKLHFEKEYKGTGIGLALTKRAIEKHNGEIWAFSEPEKGATFYFTLHQIT